MYKQTKRITVCLAGKVRFSIPNSGVGFIVGSDDASLRHFLGSILEALSIRHPLVLKEVLNRVKGLIRGLLKSLVNSLVNLAHSEVASALSHLQKGDEPGIFRKNLTGTISRDTLARSTILPLSNLGNLSQI